jgi:hypothetical protein
MATKLLAEAGGTESENKGDEGGNYAPTNVRPTGQGGADSAKKAMKSFIAFMGMV